MRPGLVLHQEEPGARCTRRNPGPAAPGGTRGPLLQEEPRARCSRRNPGPAAPGGTQGPLHQEEPRAHCTSVKSDNLLLDDVTGSITFTTMSPDSLTSITCAQCEPAHLWRELGTSLGPANSGVLWRLQTFLRLHVWMSQPDCAAGTSSNYQYWQGH